MYNKRVIFFGAVLSSLIQAGSPLTQAKEVEKKPVNNGQSCNSTPTQEKVIQKENVKNNFPSKHFDALSCKWACASRQGDRAAQEDTFFFHAHEDFIGFGIFDGHAGGHVSAYAQEKIVSLLLANYAEKKNDIIAVLRDSLDTLEKEICARYEKGGTTALIGIIFDNKLFIAWVGDSRAVVLRNGKVFAKTIDHKPCDEQDRIIKAGGTLFLHGEIWRIGGLAVSRVLGDKTIKDEHKGVIAEPSMLIHQLEPDDVVVFGSDGLWDVCTDRRLTAWIRSFGHQGYLRDYLLQAIRKNPFFRKRDNTKESLHVVDNCPSLGLLGYQLLDNAYILGSADNITAQVLVMPKPK